KRGEDVLACLRARGVPRLDALVITHYDKDHVGGAAAVVNAVPVKQVYLPGYEGHSKYYTALMKALVENDLPYRQVKEDVSFALSGVSIAVYASAVEYVYDGTKEGNDNNVSLVIAASYGQDSYLFAGDLEKAGISAYLEAGRGAFDVVKMPHHGSKKKNTDDFIADVQPKIAVITDSAADPAEAETLELLADAGADVYRTGQLGTVVITSTGRGTYSVS
ncbi:MAG: MBL fold metallo-hydrolase, partial [Clostridia bacterium]|nr:MBL fold metallo-hydrolase [Clostridia bacterium]